MFDCFVFGRVANIVVESFVIFFRRGCYQKIIRQQIYFYFFIGEFYLIVKKKCFFFFYFTFIIKNLSLTNCSSAKMCPFFYGRFFFFFNMSQGIPNAF